MWFFDFAPEPAIVSNLMVCAVRMRVVLSELSVEGETTGRSLCKIAPGPEGMTNHHQDVESKKLVLDVGNEGRCTWFS